MLEANYLTILLKPNYEKPIDTNEDVRDSGLKILKYPFSESLVEGFKNSPSSITRKLAERTEVPKVIIFYIEKVPYKFYFMEGLGRVRNDV